MAVRKMLQTATRKARKVTTSRSENPWANGEIKNGLPQVSFKGCNY
jgi:hypothetical protein